MGAVAVLRDLLGTEAQYVYGGIVSIYEASLTEDRAKARLREVIRGTCRDLTVHQAPDCSWFIRVCGAELKGAPDLTSMPLLTLVLEDCGFGTLRLDDLHARRIELRGCEGQDVSARRLVVAGDTGDLTLEHVTVRGAVDLCLARIGGRLTWRGVRILGEGSRAALKCSRVEFGDDVDLIDDCYVNGEVNLVSAEIGGMFTYTGRVDGTGGVALRCDGIHVKGAFRIGNPDDPLERTTVRGEVRLVEATVEGDVNFTNARLTNPDGIAIDAEHATVGEDLYLDKGFLARGRVRLVGARVTQLVNCTGGTFHSARGPAIEADGLVAAGLRFNREEEGRERRFSAEGGIRLNGARISREVLFSGGRITARLGEEGPVAIWAENMLADVIYLDHGCEVRGGSIRLGGARIGRMYCVGGHFYSANGTPIIMADGAEFESLFLQSTFLGGVSLRGAAVRRELNCTGGTLHNPRGKALAADRLTCGHLYLNKHFVANGIVSLWEATAEFVDCSEGTIHGGRSVQRTPTIGGYVTAALDLSGVEVRQHVLARRVRVEGGLKLAGAHISGDLDLTDAVVIPGDNGWQRTAVDAQRVAVDGTLSSWPLPWHPGAGVDLSNAHVGLLRADLKSWPSLRRVKVRLASSGLNLKGLRYGSLETQGTASVQQRLGWLASSSPFSQQPYEELARVYRERGQVSDARRVRLREQKERTRRAGLPPLSKAWNLFLEWTVGYGYRPARIFAALAVFAITGALLFHVAQHNNIMEAVSWQPQRCLQLAVSKQGGVVSRQGGVVFSGGEPVALVVPPGRTLEQYASELPPRFSGLGKAADRFETLPPCQIKADQCTNYYPCFHPTIYSVELLIPVVNLRQLTYWLPDMNANTKKDARPGSTMGQAWYLVGTWYWIYAWIAILFGWVSVTALAAGIGRVWRTD